ncbi:MAG: hypothetical protein JW881_20845 [Spirochaetales bacterium]|nr:hypothetical protein [Spirochaetales bacterium]
MPKTIPLSAFLFPFLCFYVFGNTAGAGIGFDIISMRCTSADREAEVFYAGTGIYILSLTGQPFGFLVNMNMAFLTIHASVDGSGIDPDGYRYMISADTIFPGFGVELPPGGTLTIIFGIGIHSLIMLSSEKEYSEQSFDLMRILLGTGGVVSLHFAISHSVRVMCSCHFAYDFFDIFNPASAPGGLDAGIGIGLSIEYDAVFH